MLRYTSPICPHFFQQRECAIHVRANEIIWSSDGAIHMALSCKMHDGPRPATLQQIAYQTAVCDVSMCKVVARIVCDSFQVAHVPRVRQFVQIHDGSRIPLHPLQDEIRSDKARSTSDEDRVFHIVEVVEVAPRSLARSPWSGPTLNG